VPVQGYNLVPAQRNNLDHQYRNEFEFCLSQIIVPVVDGGGPEITGLFEPPAKASAKAPAKAAAGLKLIAQESLKGGAQWFPFHVK
jgi:hypothetical protein